MRQLVLSSSSSARSQLLARLGLPFTTTSPDIDETPHPHESPTELVKRLAKSKATASVASFPDAIIIGADTVGILEGELLNKPITHENAVKQLQSMSGKTVQFYTGLCVLDAATQHYQVSAELYEVTFRTLSIEMIEDYLSKEPSYHCAGSLQAEGYGIVLIKKFEGDDFTTLIGLPLIRLVDMLEGSSVSLWSKS